MESHSNVELIFATVLDEIFVGANTAGFQCLRAELFIFVRHEMNAERKFLNERLLSAQIENTNFWVWDTTTEARFWIGLVFTITVAKNEIKEVD